MEIAGPDRLGTNEKKQREERIKEPIEKLNEFIDSQPIGSIDIYFDANELFPKLSFRDWTDHVRPRYEKAGWEFDTFARFPNVNMRPKDKPAS